MAIGKASFDDDKLLENYQAVMEEIMRAKPSSAKGRYVLSATLATTMGPGIRVDSAKGAERETVATGEKETAEEPVTA